MADEARQTLIAAIDAEDAVRILDALAKYADIEQKVRLQVMARNLIESMQLCKPLDTKMLSDLRTLVRRPSTSDDAETAGAAVSPDQTAGAADSPVPPILIGIAGQANMGKDTVGTLIRSRFPLLERRAFGDAVKQVVCSTFDVELAFIETWKRRLDDAPGFDSNMRQVLQFVGDGFRRLRPNVWVDIAMKHAPVGVYCDVRYLNEAKALTAHGGINILVGRESELNDDPNPSEATLKPLIEWFLANTTERLVEVSRYAHAAPAGANCFRFFVRNDGSIEELTKVVDEMSVSLKRGAPGSSDECVVADQP